MKSMIEEAVVCNNCGENNWYTEVEFRKILIDKIITCKHCKSGIDIELKDTILSLLGRPLH